MKINDYITLAKTNLKRRKKNVIVSILLLSISVLILVFTMSFTKSLSETMNRALLKNISYRTIAVTKTRDKTMDNVYSDLQNIKEIVKVVPSEEYSSGAELINIGEEQIKEGYIGLYGASEDIQPNIIKGRGILDNESNVCVIPNTFYPYNTYPEYDTSKKIDGESLIGKEILIQYYSYDESGIDRKVKDTFNKSFKIVGVYDVSENVSEINYCYIPFNDMEDIYTTAKEATIYNSNTTYSQYDSVMAIVDSSLNVNGVIEKIESLGYRAIVRSVVNTQLIDIINVVSIVISVVIVIIVLVNLTISCIKSLKERSYEIGILKAIGYKNKNIEKILLTENFIISAIAYIIAIILSIFIMLYVQNSIVIKNPSLEQANIRLDFMIMFIAFIISMIIPVIPTKISIKQILKKSSVTLNKEG